MITYRDYTQAEMDNFFQEFNDALPFEADEDDPAVMEDFMEWLNTIDHNTQEEN